MKYHSGIDASAGGDRCSFVDITPEELFLLLNAGMHAPLDLAYQSFAFSWLQSLRSLHDRGYILLSERETFWHCELTLIGKGIYRMMI